MARIQILELPMHHVGEVSETPFVVIIDRIETEETLATFAGMDEMAVVAQVAEQIKEAFGARGVIAYPGELEIG